MEDLGKIIIEINEKAKAAGGGAGTPGGGPGGLPAIPRMGGAIVPYTPQVPTEQKQTLTAWQRVTLGLERVMAGAAIKGEFAAFAQAPTVGGLAELGSTATTTGRALAGAGAAAVPLALAAAAVAIGAATVVGSYKILSASADRVAAKFDSIARYSGAMMFAQANERLSAMMRSMRDAQVNGLAYANAQMAATAASDAWADVMREIDGVTADLAEAFANLSLMLALTLKPLAQFAATVAGTVNFGQAFQSFMGGQFGIGGTGIAAILRGIYGSAQQIAQNTRPQNAAALNDWFRADIAAITGRGYGDIGSPQPKPKGRK